MIEALLFDLDGTLADTDPLHMRAWQEELATWELDIDEDFYRQNISGRLNPNIVADLLPELSSKEAEEVIYRKEDRFRTLADRLERLDGLESLLRWAGDHGLELALVTNAPRENAGFMLAALGLQDAFPTIVLGEDAPAGKPDPAPYRMALAELGVEAAAGMAFEDSVSGVTSAHRAGLDVVGITTTHPDAELRAAGAFLTAPDFSDAALWRELRARVER